MKDFLQKLDLLKSLSADDLNKVRDIMGSTVVAKGTILQKAGEKGHKAYYVKKGLLRSYSLDKNGREHIFMFAPEDWIVTDSADIHTAGELYIDALEDTEIDWLDKVKMERIALGLNASVRRERGLQKRLMVLQKRIIMLLSASALERYVQFLEDYPDITQRVPQRMIASYLGITPETLSKVKREYIRQGITHLNSQ